MTEEQKKTYYVILNMNIQYEICRMCPKSGLFKGTYKECESWIKGATKATKELEEEVNNLNRTIISQKSALDKEYAINSQLQEQIEKMKNLNMKARDFLVGYLRDFHKEVGWSDKVEDFVRYELKELAE